MGSKHLTWEEVLQARKLLSSHLSNLLFIKEPCLEALTPLYPILGKDCQGTMERLWNIASDCIEEAKKEEKIRIVVFGATKAGKSTLLNTLLGRMSFPDEKSDVESLLLEQHTSCTAVATIVSFEKGLAEETYYCIVTITVEDFVKVLERVNQLYPSYQTMDFFTRFVGTVRAIMERTESCGSEVLSTDLASFGKDQIKGLKVDITRAEFKIISNVPYPFRDTPIVNEIGVCLPLSDQAYINAESLELVDLPGFAENMVLDATAITHLKVSNCCIFVNDTKSAVRLRDQIDQASALRTQALLGNRVITVLSIRPDDLRTEASSGAISTAKREIAKIFSDVESDPLASILDDSLDILGHEEAIIEVYPRDPTHPGIQTLVDLLWKVVRSHQRNVCANAAGALLSAIDFSMVLIEKGLHYSWSQETVVSKEMDRLRKKAQAKYKEVVKGIHNAANTAVKNISDELNYCLTLMGERVLSSCVGTRALQPPTKWADNQALFETTLLSEAVRSCRPIVASRMMDSCHLAMRRLVHEAAKGMFLLMDIASDLHAEVIRTLPSIRFDDVRMTYSLLLRHVNLNRLIVTAVIPPLVFIPGVAALIVMGTFPVLALASVVAVVGISTFSLMMLEMTNFLRNFFMNSEEASRKAVRENAASILQHELEDMRKTYIQYVEGGLQSSLSELEGIHKLNMLLGGEKSPWKALQGKKPLRASDVRKLVLMREKLVLSVKTIQQIISETRLCDFADVPGSEKKKKNGLRNLVNNLEQSKNRILDKNRIPGVRTCEICARKYKSCEHLCNSCTSRMNMKCPLCGDTSTTAFHTLESNVLSKEASPWVPFALHLRRQLDAASSVESVESQMNLLQYTSKWAKGKVRQMFSMEATQTLLESTWKAMKGNQHTEDECILGLKLLYQFARAYPHVSLTQRCIQDLLVESLPPTLMYAFADALLWNPMALNPLLEGIEAPISPDVIHDLATKMLSIREMNNIEEVADFLVSDISEAVTVTFETESKVLSADTLADTLTLIFQEVFERDTSVIKIVLSATTIYQHMVELEGAENFYIATMCMHARFLINTI